MIDFVKEIQTRSSSVMGSSAAPLTHILRKLRDGSPAAMDELWSSVYPRVHALASGHLGGRNGAGRLQTTVVVHEAFLRLVDQRRPWNNRQHFFAGAARAIRWAVRDLCRRERAAKRGGGRTREDIEDVELSDEWGPASLLDLEAAMEELGDINPRWAEVVELRFFAGLDIADVARCMGVSVRTVHGDWRFARAWLHRRLEGFGGGEPAADSMGAASGSLASR